MGMLPYGFRLKILAAWLCCRMALIGKFGRMGRDAINRVSPPQGRLPRVSGKEGVTKNITCLYHRKFLSFLLRSKVVPSGLLTRCIASLPMRREVHAADYPCGRKSLRRNFTMNFDRTKMCPYGFRLKILAGWACCRMALIGKLGRMGRDAINRVSPPHGRLPRVSGKEGVTKNITCLYHRIFLFFLLRSKVVPSGWLTRCIASLPMRRITHAAVYPFGGKSLRRNFTMNFDRMGFYWKSTANEHPSGR